MPFDQSVIKSIILAAVAAIILTLAVNAGCGLALLAWWDVAPREALSALQAGAPYLVLGFFLATVGVILGARLAAYRPGPRPWLTGLAVGAGLALVVVSAGWIQGRLNFWLPPNAFMAVVGGWLGGWLAGRV